MIRNALAADRGGARRVQGSGGHARSTASACATTGPGAPCAAASGGRLRHDAVRGPERHPGRTTSVHVPPGGPNRSQLVRRGNQRRREPVRARRGRALKPRSSPCASGLPAGRSTNQRPACLSGIQPLTAGAIGHRARGIASRRRIRPAAASARSRGPGSRTLRAPGRGAGKTGRLRSIRPRRRRRNSCAATPPCQAAII